METGTIKAAKKVNGVDIDAMKQTIETIEKQPDLAEFRFRARNKWMGGAHNRTTIDKFYGTGQEIDTRKNPFIMDNDEHPVLLGEDNSPNPVEYVLNALAGCITTTTVYKAAAKGIRIRSLETELEGDIDLKGFLGLSDVRRGYREIRVKFKVDADAPREEIETLYRESPVYDVVTRGVPVKVQWEQA